MKISFGRSLIFVICVAVFSSNALQSQQVKPWEQIPTPKLHAFNPHQPQRVELKNGIVLFLQEDHELPFVSGSVSIPGGSRDEAPAKTGFVSLYGQTWRTSGTASFGISILRRTSAAQKSTRYVPRRVNASA